MRKASTLDALLPKTRQGILAATLVQPEKAWYVSELARRMGVPSSSLQRELQELTEAGILKSHRQGRMVYYRANPDSPLFPDLRGLLLKTAGLVDVLRDALKPLAARITLALVYGSIASGQERSESDIDLMVIGSVSPADLALPLRRAPEQLGREINPTVYSVAEFNRKRASKDHFLSQVLTSPRLIVLGSDNNLGKLLANNNVTRQPATRKELDNLRSIVSRSLKEVNAPGLSAEWHPAIYRYWDATHCVEFGYRMAQQALEFDLRHETEFPARYDKIVKTVNERFDLRGSDLSTLVVCCLDNAGKLSKKCACLSGILQPQAEAVHHPQE
jgi:DNA-binding transcriptional ArsR family regulator